MKAARFRRPIFDIDPATWLPRRTTPFWTAPRVHAPAIRGTASLRAKRCLDVVAAVLALILLAPLLAAIALLVCLDSPGPALFMQRRTGCGGSFRIIKFRTMHHHLADPGCRLQAERGDSRLTPIGGLLRRTSLDELPQLLNVLAGSMSLVGPRPHAPGTKACGRELEDVDPRYHARHRIRPGITGLAQVSFCRGSLDCEAKLRRRVSLDLAYIDQRSMAMDLRILWLTLRTILTDSGAY